MSSSELAESPPGLPLPAEPHALRSRLAPLLGADPAGADAAITKALATFLWPKWRPVLAPRGWSHARFAAVVATYAREAFLWVSGDRMWPQMLEGLAGRVERRLRS